MSEYIKSAELYKKLAIEYNKGRVPWGTNEIFKDLIAECKSYSFPEREKGTDTFFREATKEERESVDKYIKSISTKRIPMSVIEDIKAEIKETSIKYGGQTYDGLCIALKIIDKHISGKEYSFPEREKGEWVKGTYQFCGRTLECINCSNCNTPQDYYRTSKFCPNCGADMRT